MQHLANDQLIDVETLAQVLQISKRHLETLLASGDAPPFIRIGRLRRWRPEDVKTWIHKKPLQVTAKCIPSARLVADYQASEKEVHN